MPMLRGISGGCGCGMGADTPIPQAELEAAAGKIIAAGGQPVNTSVWAILALIAAMWWLGTKRGSGGGL